MSAEQSFRLDIINRYPTKLSTYHDDMVRELCNSNTALGLLSALGASTGRLLPNEDSARTALEDNKNDLVSSLLMRQQQRTLPRDVSLTLITSPNQRVVHPFTRQKVEIRIENYQRATQTLNHPLRDLLPMFNPENMPDTEKLFSSHIEAIEPDDSFLVRTYKELLDIRNFLHHVKIEQKVAREKRDWNSLVTIEKQMTAMKTFELALLAKHIIPMYRKQTEQTPWKLEITRGNNDNLKTLFLVHKQSEKPFVHTFLPPNRYPLSEDSDIVSEFRKEVEDING